VAQAQEVTGAGATFPAPLYAKWASDYNKATGLRINYQSVGPGAGLRPIHAKPVSFDRHAHLRRLGKAPKIREQRHRIKKAVGTRHPGDQKSKRSGTQNHGTAEASEPLSRIRAQCA